MLLLVSFLVRPRGRFFVPTCAGAMTPRAGAVKAGRRSTRVVRFPHLSLGGDSMNRTTWLQDRRMQKFRDVLSRWEAGVLSMKDAGELLGVSERQFRRFRDRYEEDGEEGLRDRRLGRPSPKKVPAVERSRMLKLYRETCRRRDRLIAPR